MLCKSVVRSEAVWNVHINAKQHKENIELAKKLKSRTNNFSAAPKRPLTPPLIEVSTKKIKGILKNGNSNTNSENDSENVTVVNNVEIVQKNEFPPNQTDMEVGETLPEGFFDDPKLDAKVITY